MFILVSVALVVLMCTLIGSKSKIYASSSKEAYKYYTSIQVASGDSLWSISENYLTPEHNDRKEFINEVRQLNHLGESEAIHAGEYLVIPYYSFDIL